MRETLRGPRAAYGGRMNDYRWKSLLGAALACAAAISVPSSFAAVDAKGFTILKPDELVWQHNTEGPDFAFIYGDPQKAGFYIVRARFAPGVMSKPHYHPTDRFVTVISGTWWAGTNADGDRSKTVPLGPGGERGAFRRRQGRRSHRRDQRHWPRAVDTGRKVK